MNGSSRLMLKSHGQFQGGLGTGPGHPRLTGSERAKFSR